MVLTEVILRPAVAADAASVAEVNLASRARASMPPGIHTDDEVREWLGGRLETDEVWVAEVDTHVAAYARLTETWLDDLYVHPEHAGKGIGGALLDVAKAQRAAGFCLWVFEMNSPARAFYRRHGLVELERTDGATNEEREPDIRMAWPGSDPLAFYRGLIDEVDAELGELLNRRSALTRAIQPHKATSARDLTRERRIAEAMAQRAPLLGVDRIEEIVNTIVTQSLDAASRFSGP